MSPEEQKELIINLPQDSCKDSSNEHQDVNSNDKHSYCNIIWKMSKLGVPMALSFTMSFEVFSSGLLLGHLSDDPNHKAAITLVTTFMNIILITGMSPLFAMPVLLSNRLGDYRKYLIGDNLIESELSFKQQRISAIHRGGLIIAGAATPFMFLSLFYSKFLAHNLFAQDENVSDIAQKFLRPYAFAVPGVMSRMVFEQIIFTNQKAKHAMYIGLSTFSIGTLISYWLAFHENKNAEGVALGYVIESYLIAIAYGMYIAFHPDLKQFKFFRLFSITKEAAKGVISELLSWGAPISFTMINELLMTFVIGLIAGSIDPDAQASMSYLMQFIFFTFVPMAAFGIASQQEVGREVGAKQYTYAGKLAKGSLITSLIYLAPPSILVLIYPEVLQKTLGSTSSEIINKTHTLGRIMASGVICDAARYTILQELRALADPWGSTMISASGLWTGLIMAGLLSKTELGVYGVGIGYSSGIALAMFGLAIRWFSRVKESYIETVNQRMKSLPSFTQYCKSLFSTARTYCGAMFHSNQHAQQLHAESIEQNYGSMKEVVRP